MDMDCTLKISFDPAFSMTSFSTGSPFSVANISRSARETVGDFILIAWVRNFVRVVNKEIRPVAFAGRQIYLKEPGQVDC